ncbi:MAG: flavin reductase family protein [Solirubrobacterales bacterium]
MALQPDMRTFLDAMAEIPAGVAVVTTLDSVGTPAGATLSAVSSVSLDPPLILACFDHGSDTLAAVLQRGAFLLHLLGEGQEAVAKRFASEEGKFAERDWSLGPHGLPQLESCSLVLRCSLEQVVDAGDHRVLFGRVLEIDHRAGRPLVYHRRMLAPSPVPGA